METPEVPIHEPLPVLHRAQLRSPTRFVTRPVLAREGGSIPVVATFEEVLEVPTVLMGIGLQDDNLHAPNEKLDLDNFYRGIKTAALFMEELRSCVP